MKISLVRHQLLEPFGRPKEKREKEKRRRCPRGADPKPDPKPEERGPGCGGRCLLLTQPPVVSPALLLSASRSLCSAGPAATPGSGRGTGAAAAGTDARGEEVRRLPYLERARWIFIDSRDGFVGFCSFRRRREDSATCSLELVFFQSCSLRCSGLL
ncbi:hypothetical protein NDU88_002777 [Pleurodeles waltl]|uniref:Uncharacterized protein n=1 Tax=Pleurodeles waltl TaxID=8319 RepID=A0AAV7PA28_PLEWA|nr:hypothetical protein NDU88_002777 [Pleurodeles waltl]